MSDFSNVVDLVVKHTQDGAVSEWSERIANIARSINLPLCNIEWNGTPKHIAHSLVGYSFRYYSSHDKLLQYLGDNNT